ncbi:MAG TPA: chitobiase/beta-hexosaminidase C-terminal domain-containing protein, partial [Solirubrobacteraceae bacterium]
LTVAGAYTVPGGTVTGSELSVVKDTVAPGAPASTPAPGTYDSAQSLSLTSADPSAEIHYTVDGSDPTPTSRTAAGQVRVTSTQTLKAIAVDPAGNASGVSTLDYVITPQAPTVITLPTAPILQPQPLAKLALGRLTLRHKVSRADLRRRGLRAGLSLPEGTEVLRVRLYRTGPRKLLTSFWRFPTSDGEYRLIVRSKKATRLGRGKYVLEVTPGRSKRSLGTAQQVAFQVR